MSYWDEWEGPFLCRCKQCPFHDKDPEGDVCAEQITTPETQWRCPLCRKDKCSRCVIKCNEHEGCNIAICRECDYCPACEEPVCRYCIEKKECNGCHKKFCHRQWCDDLAQSCDRCKFTYCGECREKFSAELYQCHGNFPVCGKIFCTRCGQLDHCQKCDGFYCEHCYPGALRHTGFSGGCNEQRQLDREALEKSATTTLRHIKTKPVPRKKKTAWSAKAQRKKPPIPECFKKK